MSNKGSILPKINFPIIVTDNTWSFIDIVEKKEIMTIRPKSSINSDPLLGCLLIDSNGNSYIVKKIVGLGYINVLFGYSFKLGRSVYADIKLDNHGTIKLEEMKSMINSFVSEKFMNIRIQS